MGGGGEARMGAGEKRTEGRRGRERLEGEQVKRRGERRTGRGWLGGEEEGRGGVERGRVGRRRGKEDRRLMVEPTGKSACL